MIGRDKPIFVHSDVGRGLIAAKRAGEKVDTKNICASLLRFLAEHIDDGQEGILFPAFNYDYEKTRVFKPDEDPVQVGAMPEWIRVNGEYKRSDVPFFSVLSMSKLRFGSNELINPFGKESVFHWLVSQDANLILFGADLSSLTFIHYVEEMVGKPVYRYEKKFPGEIVRGNRTQFCELSMHVRPLGVHMDYHWSKLERDLVASGILNAANYSGDFKSINARQLLDYWGNKIADDPFYLLDPKSRQYFQAATENGTLRVKLKSYEKSD